MSDNDNQYHLFYLDNGVQAQAGKPFYHQKGSLTMYNNKLSSNDCLCKYPCKRWYPVYQKLSSQSASYTFYISQSSTNKYKRETRKGYTWKLLEGSPFGQPYNIYYIGQNPPMTPGKWHTLPQLVYDNSNVATSQPSPSYIQKIPIRETLRVMYVSDYRCEPLDEALTQNDTCYLQSTACGTDLTGGVPCQCSQSATTILSPPIPAGVCCSPRLYFSTGQRDQGTGIVTWSSWTDYNLQSLQNKPEIPQKIKLPFDIAYKTIDEDDFSDTCPLNNYPDDIYYEDCIRAWAWAAVPCSVPHSSTAFAPSLPQAQQCTPVIKLTYAVQGNCWWYYTGTNEKYSIHGTPPSFPVIQKDCQKGIAYVTVEDEDQKSCSFLPFQSSCSCVAARSQSTLQWKLDPNNKRGWGSDTTRIPCNIPQPSNQKYLSLVTANKQLYNVYSYTIKQKKHSVPGSDSCFIYQAPAQPEQGHTAWTRQVSNATEYDVLTSYIITGKIVSTAMADDKGWILGDTSTSQTIDGVRYVVTTRTKYRLLPADVAATDVTLPQPDISSVCPVFNREGEQPVKECQGDQRYYRWIAAWWCNSRVPQQFSESQLTLWTGWQGPRNTIQNSLVCKGWLQGPRSQLSQSRDAQSMHYGSTWTDGYVQQAYRGLPKVPSTSYYYIDRVSKTQPCTNYGDISQMSQADIFWDAYSGCIAPLSKRKHKYVVRSVYSCYNGGTLPAQDPYVDCDYDMRIDENSCERIYKTLDPSLARFLRFEAESAMGMPRGPHINTWAPWYGKTNWYSSAGFANSFQYSKYIKVTVGRDATEGPQCDSQIPSDSSTPGAQVSHGLRYFYTCVATCTRQRDPSTGQPKPVWTYTCQNNVVGCNTFAIPYTGALHTGFDSNTPLQYAMKYDDINGFNAGQFPEPSQQLDSSSNVVDNWSPTQPLPLLKQTTIDDCQWRINAWISPGDPKIQSQDPCAQPINPISNAQGATKLIQVVSCDPAQQFMSQSHSYSGAPPSDSLCMQPWYPFQVQGECQFIDDFKAEFVVTSVTKLPCIPAFDPITGQRTSCPSTPWREPSVYAPYTTSRIYTMNQQRSSYAGHWNNYPVNCTQYDNTTPTPQYYGDKPGCQSPGPCWCRVKIPANVRAAAASFGFDVPAQVLFTDVTKTAGDRMCKLQATKTQDLWTASWSWTSTASSDSACLLHYVITGTVDIYNSTKDRRILVTGYYEGDNDTRTVSGTAYITIPPYPTYPLPVNIPFTLGGGCACDPRPPTECSWTFDLNQNIRDFLHIVSPTSVTVPVTVTGQIIYGKLRCVHSGEIIVPTVMQPGYQSQQGLKAEVRYVTTPDGENCSASWLLQNRKGFGPDYCYNPQRCDLVTTTGSCCLTQQSIYLRPYTSRSAQQEPYYLGFDIHVTTDCPVDCCPARTSSRALNSAPTRSVLQETQPTKDIYYISLNDDVSDTSKSIQQDSQSLTQSVQKASADLPAQYITILEGDK